MDMKNFVLLIIFTLTALALSGQTFEIGGDFRVRPEYRHGYGTLIPDSVEGAGFVNQRLRLNLNFANKHLKMRVSPQNVRTWGDVVSTSKSDLSLSFHEAWCEGIISPRFSFRLGRQELVYDDHRILGNVDWLMQARSHDAGLFLFKLDSSNVVHVGAAYNANKESNYRENYLLPQFKAMQFVWYHGTFKLIGLSFLLLNNGMPYLKDAKEKLAYSQTIGPRITYTNGKWNGALAAYLQAGKIAENKVNSQYFAANLDYGLTKSFSAGAGFEYLSGKDGDDASTDLKSFNPLYGTNHRFNGFMDYFYVGNHLNSVGLTDVYADFSFKKGKFTAKLTPHYFATAGTLIQGGEPMDNYLGTEVDLTLGYKLIESTNLTAGVSGMFPTDSMKALKGGSNDDNYWAYLTIAFSPKLYASKTD